MEGVPGPLFYPAGKWNALTTFERTKELCPFVLYDTGNPETDLYYYLNKEVRVVGNPNNINPKADYAANGVNATWRVIENIGYVFANFLMANFGLIAGAVFNNNKLFSQHGVDASGNASNDYKNPNFIPHILIDWLNGSGWFAGKNIMFGKDNSVQIIGNLESRSGENKVVIKPDGEWPRITFFRGETEAMSFYMWAESGYATAVPFIRLRGKAYRLINGTWTTVDTLTRIQAGKIELSVGNKTKIISAED